MGPTNYHLQPPVGWIPRTQANLIGPTIVGSLVKAFILLAMWLTDHLDPYSIRNLPSRAERIEIFVSWACEKCPNPCSLFKSSISLNRLNLRPSTLHLTPWLLIKFCHHTMTISQRPLCLNTESPPVFCLPCPCFGALQLKKSSYRWVHLTFDP